MGSPGRRLELRKKFTDILGTTGQETTRTYFQPPSSVRMEYPAIVYKRNRIRNQFADNQVYLQDDEWEVTVIDEDPDSEIVRAVSQLPKCQHNRHFVVDNLNHDVFILYY